MTMITPKPLPDPMGSAGTVGVMKPPKSSASSIPQGMDLASLMTWLSGRMRKSDDAIRAKMADMETRKGTQKELTNLVNALRESRRGGDIGDGTIQLAAPLNDPDNIRNAEWFKNLDPTMRDKLENLFKSFRNEGYIVKSDELSVETAGGKTTWKRDSVISEAEMKEYGLKEDAKLVKVNARLPKDQFEDAILNLGDMSKDLGNSDEIEMIKLQSEVSARGQLLELISNMMAKASRTSDAIIGNLK